MPAILTCEVCGTEFKVPPSRAATAKTCSHACAVSVRAESRKRRTTINCKQCGKPFETPNCHVSRRIFCSRACLEASPKMKAVKADRQGEKNPHWKGGRTNHVEGYRYLRATWHPFASKTGYVLEHRIVMERWLLQNDPASPFLTYVDGHLVLSPEYHVHHKDEDKANNAIENLECLTPDEHRREHNSRRLN